MSRSVGGKSSHLKRGPLFHLSAAIGPVDCAEIIQIQESDREMPTQLARFFSFARQQAVQMPAIGYLRESVVIRLLPVLTGEPAAFNTRAPVIRAVVTRSRFSKSAIRESRPAVSASCSIN